MMKMSCGVIEHVQVWPLSTVSYGTETHKCAKV